ncbi:formylglycine-generating enzyme family protein, partial [Gemmatimonadota bacterium]
VKLLLTLCAALFSLIADVRAEAPDCPGSIKGIGFVRIDGGTFLMGSEGYGADEVPIHEVSVDGFCMSATEITQRQVLEVTGKLPWTGSWEPPPRTREDSLRATWLDSIRTALEAAGSDRLGKYVPEAAVWISWNGAVEFCNNLSRLAGLEPCYDLETWECDFSRNGFRLPTEAEWEYACRAGTNTTYFTGDNPESLSEAAWFSQISENPGKRLVGRKKPNAFGLYDMHGNIWEWCNDWYGPAYYAVSPRDNPSGSADSGPGELRVNRGGSRSSSPLACRSAVRRGNPPAARNSTIGFRVVRRK